MVKYLINEKKRTISAYFAGGESAVVDCLFQQVERYDPNSDFSDFYADAVTDTMNSFSGTFVGIARCHPEDEWNEDIGKNIARTKLMSRMDKAIDSVNDNLVRIVTKKLETFKSRISVH
jgi:hypothetical protein